MSYYYVTRARRSTLKVRSSDKLEILFERKKTPTLKEVKSDQSKERTLSLYQNFVRLTTKVITTHPMTPIQTKNSPSALRRRTRWFIAAWFVCLSVIAASAYFVMLYGLKMGPVYSLKWLTSVMMSIGEEVAVSGPIRILIAAIILSVAHRTLFEVNTQSVVLNKVMMLRPQNSDRYIEDLVLKRSERAYAPLKGKTAKAMLHKYRKRRQWWNLIEFVVAVCFVIVLHKIIFEMWTSHYYTNSTVCRFISRAPWPSIGGISFEEVTNTSTMETFLSLTFIHTIFNLRWYNGHLIGGGSTAKYWTGNCIHHMIGLPVVRQFRAIPETCENLIGANGSRLPPLRLAKPDTDTYDYGWRAARYDSRAVKNSPWRFTEPSSSPVITDYRMAGLSGRMYDSGGYQTTLGPTRAEAENTVDTLARAHWLTVHTRAVFAELTLYNVNEDMFSQVTLIVEYFVSGATLVRVKSTSLEFSINYHALHLLFIVFIIYFIVCGMFFVNREGMLERLSKFSGISRLLVIVLGLATICLSCAHHFVSMRFAKEFQRRGKESYFDFDSFFFYFSQTKLVLSVLLCLAIFRALQLMRLGTRFLSHFYMLIIPWYWLLWLALLSGFTYFLFYLISVLLATFVPRGFRGGKPESLDDEICFLEKRFSVARHFVFCVITALFLAIFKHYSRVAKGYKAGATGGFNFITFFIAQLKQTRRTRLSTSGGST